MTSRWWFYPALVVLALPLLPILLLVFAAIITYPTLPTLETLTDYRPKMPLRVFSAEGTLIGEFGEERRELVKIEDVPDLMKKAILAAEDDRFYEHGGVDYIGVLRAAYSNFTSGGVKQGASTITMQVARNFFLSKEKTLRVNSTRCCFPSKSSTTSPRMRFSSFTSIIFISGNVPMVSLPPPKSITPRLLVSSLSRNGNAGRITQGACLIQSGSES